MRTQPGFQPQLSNPGRRALTRRFVLVLVLERGYSYGLALQLCGSALSEFHPPSGLEVLKGRQIAREKTSKKRCYRAGTRLGRSDSTELAEVLALPSIAPGRFFRICFGIE